MIRRSWWIHLGYALFFFGILIFISYFVFKKIEAPGPSQIESSILAEDRTPPAPPRTDPIPRYTSEDTIFIKGNTEADSLLKIYLNDRIIKEIKIDNTSSFSLEIKLEKGENKIWFTAIDMTGNESENSAVLPIVYGNYQKED